MIKSDLYASYDAKLVLAENEISFGCKDREIYLYFENEEDIEKARKILKEKNLFSVDQPLTMELLQEVADKCYQAGYEDGKNAGIIIPEWGKSNEPYKIIPYYTGDMPFTFCDSKTSDVSIRATT